MLYGLDLPLAITFIKTVQFSIITSPFFEPGSLRPLDPQPNYKNEQTAFPLSLIGKQTSHHILSKVGLSSKSLIWGDWVKHVIKGHFVQTEKHGIVSTSTLL